MKKMSLEISQNSLENTRAWVSFLIKKLWQRCFPVNTSLHRTPLVAVSDHLLYNMAYCYIVDHGLLL